MRVPSKLVSEAFARAIPQELKKAGVLWKDSGFKAFS